MYIITVRRIWSVKSPAGDGRHSQDYNKAETAEDLQKAMAEIKD